MAESGSPNDPAEHVVELSTQVEDGAMNGSESDVQNMLAGESSKLEGAEPGKKATREENQDAQENAKQEDKSHPTRLSVFWSKLGLDPVTLILMFK